MKKKTYNVIELYEQYQVLSSFSVHKNYMLYKKMEPLYHLFTKYPKTKTTSNKECEYIAYRFQMKPSEEQASLLSQFAGSARWLYNHLKADSDAYYKETGKILQRTPTYYKNRPEYVWLRDMDSLALCNAQLHFEQARTDWLKGNKGKPKFKKKGTSAESYTTNNVNNSIKLFPHTIKLPKIDTHIPIRHHRKIKNGGVLKSCIVTKEPNGRWYVSVLMEYPKEVYTVPSWYDNFLDTGDITDIRHIGLDMSLPYMYVDSNGNRPQYHLKDSVVKFEKTYRSLERKIAKEQRKLSQKVKNSNNYKKQQKKIASLHAKAKHRRRDFLHQMAIRLVSEYDIISIEDLDIAGMKKALKFGKSLSDNGWGMFVTLLEEKAFRHDTFVVKIDKWFPSSKTCSQCRYIHKELSMSDRTYVCPECGNIMDRDIQAAINIDKEGLQVALLANHKKIKTGGTPGLGCYNYGVYAKPLLGGNIPKTSPVYAVIKERLSQLA